MVYPSPTELLSPQMDIVTCACLCGWASPLPSLLYLIWHGHVFPLKPGSSVPSSLWLSLPSVPKAQWANLCSSHECGLTVFYTPSHSQLSLWLPVTFVSESPVASRRCWVKLFTGAHVSHWWLQHSVSPTSAKLDLASHPLSYGCHEHKQIPRC